MHFLSLEVSFPAQKTQQSKNKHILSYGNGGQYKPSESPQFIFISLV